MPLAPIKHARAAIKIIVSVILLLPLWVAAQAVPVQAVGAGAMDVSPALAVLEDADGSLTLPEVLAADRAGRMVPRPGASQGLSLGFTRSAFWLRLEVRNPGSAVAHQLLEVSNARISHVSFFVPDDAGRYTETRTGGDLPFATRAVAHRHLVFPLQVAPQATQVVYLRVQSTIGLIVPVQLWARPDLDEHTHTDYMLHAWYYGMATAMLVFNLMLWVALRDRIYGYYVVFVGATALMLASKAGLASQYFWPGALVWSNFSYYTAASVGAAAFCLFTRRMLDTATVLPRVHRALQALAAVHLLAPLVYWFAITPVARFATLLFLLTVLAVTAVGAWCAFLRMRSAYYFLGAFGMLAVGSLVTTARSFGWLPTNAFTVNGFQLGSNLEMLLLAFALADRFNQMRREKHMAQRELVSTQQQLVETLRASELELAQRVEERTRQLQAANARLEALSMVDGLTGIANRRHFDQVLLKEWARLERAGQPLALVMLDVDWFKRYNDHFGHQAGDECLRGVAQAISGVSRASDLVARYGGEEFVIIAPGTDGSQALQMAQRACDAVRALGMPHPLAYESVVTVSCGVAVTVPGPEDSLESLLGQADDALYEAKAQGRNRVVLAEALGG
ncbi:MAG: diguanylate cyclase [Betaproteobacteria bacterium]|nr:diguanylate cyclase [Betaproteobacteria bacterium]